MLKKYLITGLLVWVPLAFTLWVLDLIVSTMDRTLLLLPPPWRPESWLGFALPGAGLLMSAVILLLTGMIAANIMGQRVGGPAGPHPDRAFDLLERETGLGHAAVARRPLVPEGGPGRVSAARPVDHRVRGRHIVRAHRAAPSHRLADHLCADGSEPDLRIHADGVAG
jgi:hypothetical protein